MIDWCRWCAHSQITPRDSSQAHNLSHRLPEAYWCDMSVNDVMCDSRTDWSMLSVHSHNHCLLPVALKPNTVFRIRLAYLNKFDNNSFIIAHYLCPEWPHRQCVGLSFRRSHDRGWLSAVSLVICSPARIAVCNTWSSGGTALCRMGGCDQSIRSTVSDAIVCSWLWLTATRGSPWATSVNYCK